MDIDDPAVVAEVMAAFTRYEQAVVANDSHPGRGGREPGAG